MAVISSKFFFHYASPLLRALNLSNDARCPAIPAKIPSSPFSFRPQNPPYGRFPYSMVSSMPQLPSFEWLLDQPSRLQVHIHNSLPKAITRISTSNDLSVNAVSFLHKNAPNSSDTITVAVDIPSSLNPSSLMQTCSELETEAGLCHKPHASMEASQPAAVEKKFSGGSDAYDEVEAFCKWEIAASSSVAASSSPADSESNEMKKFGDNVSMHSLPISSFAGSSVDESEWSAAKEITGIVLVATLLPSPVPTPHTGGKLLFVWGRQGMEDYILKLEEQRRRAVAALVWSRPVFLFTFRGCMQLLIRLRSLQKEVTIIKHQQCSQNLEAGRYKIISNNFFLREGCEDKSQYDIDEVSIEESMIGMQIQQSDYYISIFVVPIDHFDGENNHFPRLTFTREMKISPQAFCSLQALLSRQEEDPQYSQSSDVSWDEIRLWRSSFGWKRPSDLTEYNLWRGWGQIRRTCYNDLLKTNLFEKG